MDSRYYDDDAQPDAPLLGLDELDSDGEGGHNVDGDAPGGSVPAIKTIPGAAFYQVKTPRGVCQSGCLRFSLLSGNGRLLRLPSRYDVAREIRRRGDYADFSVQVITVIAFYLFFLVLSGTVA